MHTKLKLNKSNSLIKNDWAESINWISRFRGWEKQNFEAEKNEIACIDEVQ